MSERRDCGVVIVEMLEHVPENRIAFIDRLKWHINDSIFKAPEETLQWERTMNSLIQFIPHPKEEWEFKVLSIFTTKSIEDLKKTFKEHLEVQNNGNQNAEDK